MNKRIISRITIVITFLILPFSCEKFDSECDICSYVDFRYYKNEPYNIGVMSDDFILIGYDSILNDKEISDLFISYSFLDKNYQPNTHQIRSSKYKYTIVKLRKSYSCSQINCIQEELKDNPDVGYANYTSIVENCADMQGWLTDSSCVLSYGDIFYVKVKDTTDLTPFLDIVYETNTEIVSRDNSMKQWFTLCADKNSNGNALQMANFFFETGIFAASEPSFAQFEVE